LNKIANSQDTLKNREIIEKLIIQNPKTKLLNKPPDKEKSKNE
jgi:hypothetical protein